MAFLARLRRTKLEPLWIIGGLIVAWAVQLAGLWPLRAYIARRLYDSYRAWDGTTNVSDTALYLTSQILRFVWETCDVAVVAGTLVGPLILLARMIARSRVRSGERDPLDRVRAWAAKRPWGVRALLWTPAGLVAGAMAARELLDDPTQLPYVLFPLLGLGWLARVGFRTLVAPTVDEVSARAPVTVSDEEIAFSAVAVTRETVATVAAFACLPFVSVAALHALRDGGDTAFVSVMLAYIGVAAGGATLFQRASRIAVGLDGVLVHGTSRTRFFAYRDIDSVRVRGPNVELCKGSRMVLRLQLHGEDALRRDAIVARIEQKIAHAAARRTGTAEGFVEGASADQIARAVAGAVDFRQPVLSRDALWDVVLGPTLDMDARVAAAAALAKTSDPEERAKLRVAAAQCAQPRVRVALEKLGAEEEEAAQAEAEAATEGEALRRAY